MQKCFQNIFPGIPNLVLGSTRAGNAGIFDSKITRSQFKVLHGESCRELSTTKGVAQGVRENICDGKAVHMVSLKFNDSFESLPNEITVSSARGVLGELSTTKGEGQWLFDRFSYEPVFNQ